MKIFVLEDNAERVGYFYKQFLFHELTVCNNVGSAFKILCAEKFDVMFLDHDLGDLAFVDVESENTGSELCRRMDKTINTDVAVLIHSWNENGAKKMKSLLENNGHSAKVDCCLYMTDEFYSFVNGLL